MTAPLWCHRYLIGVVCYLIIHRISTHNCRTHCLANGSVKLTNMAAANSRQTFPRIFRCIYGPQKMCLCDKTKFASARTVGGYIYI